MTAALAGAACAALGALILGEYELVGATPYVAGVLFGLVVAEVVLTVAGLGTPVLAAAAGGASGLGMWWAVWISSGRGVVPIPAPAYAGVALSVVVSLAWLAAPGRWRRPGRSGRDDHA